MTRRGPALTTAGLALAAVAVRVRDPHVHGSWGYCPLALMGIWCPGCGGLRAVNDLGHGDVAAAASSNLLVVALAPLVVALLAAWWYDAVPAGVGRTLAARPVQVGLVGLVLAFTVLRNLPAGAWLAP